MECINFAVTEKATLYPPTSGATMGFSLSSVNITSLSMLVVNIIPSMKFSYPKFSSLFFKKSREIDYDLCLFRST